MIRSDEPSQSLPAATALPRPLTKRQLRALAELSEDGFRVNWRPLLGWRGYRDLRERGLIEEAWTWASHTRPDVRRTSAGTDAINERLSRACDGIRKKDVAA